MSAASFGVDPDLIARRARARELLYQAVCRAAWAPEWPPRPAGYQVQVLLPPQLYLGFRFHIAEHGGYHLEAADRPRPYLEVAGFTVVPRDDNAYPSMKVVLYQGVVRHVEELSELSGFHHDLEHGSSL